MISSNSVYMVVDDYESMRKIHCSQLRALGAVHIFSASNGVEALRILRNNHVDLVFSDLNMPVMSGMDLLKSIRSNEKLYRLPFVMITSEAGRDYIEEAIACGVTDFMVKPYSASILESRIKKALTWSPPRNAPTVVAPPVAVASPPALPPGKGTPPSGETPHSILVVDDTPDNLLLLSNLFKNEYRVRIANNGEKALEICCSDNPPDLVLLDVMMPGMDGFKVAQRMREHPNAESIPVIFVTAMTGDEAHLKGLALGAVDFVSKPINPELLESRVRNFMRYVALRKQLQADYDGMLAAAKLREDVEQMTRHDLKGPLAAVIGLARRLADESTLTRRQSEQLGMIEESALQVLNMINLSSELFKIEAGLFKLNAVPVEIGDILRRIAESARASVTEKRLNIVLDESLLSTGNTSARILGDDTLCYSLFCNLINNACEAAPNGSSILLSMQNDDPVGITIRNSGTVPVEIRDSFFEKFVTHGKTGGTGLGTYSAKLLTEAQHGEIDLQVSDDENLTTVTVSLPKYRGSNG